MGLDVWERSLPLPLGKSLTVPPTQAPSWLVNCKLEPLPHGAVVRFNEIMSVQPDACPQLSEFVFLSLQKPAKATAGFILDGVSPLVLGLRSWLGLQTGASHPAHKHSISKVLFWA